MSHRLAVSLADLVPIVGYDESTLLTIGVGLVAFGALRFRR